MTTRREFLKSLSHPFFAALKTKKRDGSIFLDNSEPYSTKPLKKNRTVPFFCAQLDVVRCLAWGGAACQLCYLSCPRRDKAIRMEDQKPLIDATVCDGCGMCESACQTVNDLPAITMIVRQD